MVADTIDAMTTDRPYRKALGFDVVVAELQKYRGTQFDPSLVDCVINSVSVRRVLAQGGTETDSEGFFPTLGRATPLRSHGSFFMGRRKGQEAVEFGS